jgi:hypothetical protein
VEESK